MRTLVAWLSGLGLVAAAAGTVAGQEAAEADAPAAGQPLPEEYSCKLCHDPDGDLAIEGKPNLLVTEEKLAGDIHWQRGLRCHDCHGGSPTFEGFVEHRDDETFHSVLSPADIPGFCGRCHSDIAYMRRFSPSARTDQEAEYWTSGHGRALKALEDAAEAKVATCVDCHQHHGILAVDDQRSPIYPTHVAQTCSRCHSDQQLMAGRTYHDRPLGHDQYDKWRRSVHGKALLDKGDLSAPTCNDCHGNHGALPPEVGSVANACGTCHGKVAKLFAETRMKHKFEEVGLPGCATCHGNHQTLPPTDTMLGMGGQAVCAGCHEENRYGATLTGAEVARTMRDDLDNLKREIREAEDRIAEAERLGMEVRTPRFDLRQARDALTNSRSLIHSFSKARFDEALGKGHEVAAQVQQRALDALREHTRRRIWLAASLVPILLVVGLLLAYIRTLPAPAR